MQQIMQNSKPILSEAQQNALNSINITNRHDFMILFDWIDDVQKNVCALEEQFNIPGAGALAELHKIYCSAIQLRGFFSKSQDYIASKMRGGN